MLNLGIVGCGRVTTMFHLKAIKEVEDLSIVAVVDRHKPSMEGVKNACGANKGYCDFFKLLSDPQVEAVVINTPPQLHEEMVIQALQAGKHVLCEKPLATSVEGAMRIRDVAKGSGKVVLTVHNYAFTPSLENAIKLIEEGSLGKVEKVTVKFENNLRGYRARTDFRLKDEFGIVEDVLPHVLSATKALSGTATAIEKARGWKKSYKVVDNLSLILRTDKDAELDCFMSWTKLIPSFKIAANCESGSVETDLIRNPYGITVERKGKRNKIDQKKGLGIYLDIIRFKHPSFQNQYKHLYRVVEGVEKPRLNIDDEIAMIGMIGEIVGYLSKTMA